MKDAGIRRAANADQVPNHPIVSTGNVDFIHEAVARTDGRFDHYYYHGVFRFNSYPKALRFGQNLNSFSAFEVYLKQRELGMFVPTDPALEKFDKFTRTRIHMSIEKTLDDIATRNGTTLAEMRARGHLGNLQI